MLNSKNERELAYIVRVDNVEPIEGRDRVECAVVNGWTMMVRKDQFKAGDLGIYFEIDSKTPETEPFAFLAQKHFQIKTQKYKTPSGHFFSQGLLMAAEDFGWEMSGDQASGFCDIIDSKTGELIGNVDDESRFLTVRLGVTYAVAEDNTRKASSVDKYKKMAQRHGKLFARKPFKWLMRYNWGRKLLFVFFGKKNDKSDWPQWVKKTDEERVENMAYILADKEPWIATEKIDGTSTTFTLKRKRFGQFDFYVCSRNVVFDKPDKPCFYDSNVYKEMAFKYNVEDALKKMLCIEFPYAEWITLQGETYGGAIQKRDYSTDEHRFAGFNLITSEKGRLNSVCAKDICERYGIPWVPILDTKYVLPDTIDELRDFVNSEPSRIDGIIKEGIVFRDLNGDKSFKCVSPEFLIKYHR